MCVFLRRWCERVVVNVSLFGLCENRICTFSRIRRTPNTEPVSNSTKQDCSHTHQRDTIIKHILAFTDSAISAKSSEGTWSGQKNQKSRFTITRNHEQNLPRHCVISAISQNPNQIDAKFVQTTIRDSGSHSATDTTAHFPDVVITSWCDSMLAHCHMP